ncbi:MAG TPA: sulfite exporter TauE/SafE family protein, partial [Candidatus Hypogeohydataceae bacterium YC40]
METLVLSALGIGLIHSLAPDHWAPFASLAKAQGWSKKKLLFISFLAGLGHVGSSFILGAIGIVLGMGLARLEGI